MTEKIFLLVCEGETDVYIFQALAAHFSHSEKQLTIISLAPQQDATSGTYPTHSFGQVLAWCKNHPENSEDEDIINIEYLLDFKGASALFIQMDTDIAKQANPECVAQNTYSARHCCEEKINQNLGTIQEPPRCHYILPTQNTETWILASHNSAELEQIEDFEIITNTEQKLIDLGYKSKKGKSNSVPRKLNKNPATDYKKHGKQLTANLILARKRCTELNRLCTLLETI